jgi:hypothetical protein
MVNVSLYKTIIYYQVSLVPLLNYKYYGQLFNTAGKTLNC